MLGSASSCGIVCFFVKRPKLSLPISASIAECVVILGSCAALDFFLSAYA